MRETSLLDFFTNLLTAGLAHGTPLLLASLGELFAERAGVLNLGVEGMMLVGGATGFVAGLLSQSAVLGLLAAMAAAGLLALVHAFISVTLVGDQVVSGLGLNFFGVGLAAIIGAAFVGATGAPRLPSYEISLLSSLPLVGKALGAQNLIVYIGFLLIPLAHFYLYHTRPGLLLRAVGENPTAVDAQGFSVARLRYVHTILGGALAGLAGASLSLAITPGWVEGLTGGQGWIAVGLVIFAGWDPRRCALGAYLFGLIRRLPLDLQGRASLPFLRNPNLGYFLDMLPYLFTILVLIIVSNSKVRRSLRTPATLSLPFVRGGR